MIEEVIEKYNYSPDLANFLRKLYPYLLEYFGSSNKDVIDNTKREELLALINNEYHPLFNKIVKESRSV